MTSNKLSIKYESNFVKSDEENKFYRDLYELIFIEQNGLIKRNGVNYEGNDMDLSSSVLHIHIKNVKYIINQTNYKPVYELFNEAYKTGLCFPLMERACEESSAHFDFDIKSPINFDDVLSIFDSDDFHRIGNIIIEEYMKMYNISKKINNFFMVFLVKPKKGKSTNEMNRYGLHIKCPSIIMSKFARITLMKNLSLNTDLINFMEEKFGVDDSFIDELPASTSIFVYGSCIQPNDRAGKVYKIKEILKYSITKDNHINSTNVNWDMNNVNLQLELSGVFEGNIIKKIKLKLKPNYYTLEQQSIEKKIYKKTDELHALNLDIETLCGTDTDANILCQLLELFPKNTQLPYDKWRNIVISIQNTNVEYKPIARIFTEKYRIKHSKQSPDEIIREFETLWDNMLNTNDRILTFTYIKNRCTEIDEEETEKILNSSIINILDYRFSEICGLNAIGDLIISSMIKNIVHGEYHCDKFGKDNIWYEFINNKKCYSYVDQSMKYKWRKNTPGDNSIISLRKLYQNDFKNHIIKPYIDALDIKIRGCINENLEKKYIENKKEMERILKDLAVDVKLEKYIKSLSSDCKLNEIMKANTTMEKYLDSDPRTFGISNGILLFDKQYTGENWKQSITYTSGINNYFVSKASRAQLKPFEPQKEIIEECFDKVRRIFINDPDAFYKFMLLGASAFNSDEKAEIQLIMIHGYGSDGKSTWFDTLDCVFKTVNPEESYEVRPNSQMLFYAQLDSDKPSPETMSLDGPKVINFDEVLINAVVNDTALKNLCGGEQKGRTLYDKKSVTVKTNAVKFLATNSLPRVMATDHGTFRRISTYSAKTKFVDGTPSSKNEYKKDYEWKNDKLKRQEYINAYLYIFMVYFLRLQRDYKGETVNFKSPTIESESEDYRNSQNVIHKYIMNNIVKEKVVGDDYTPTQLTLYDIAKKFLIWQESKIDKKDLYKKDFIVTELKKTDLRKIKRGGGFEKNEDDEDYISGFVCLGDGVVFDKDRHIRSNNTNIFKEADAIQRPVDSIITEFDNAETERKKEIKKEIGEKFKKEIGKDKLTLEERKVMESQKRKMIAEKEKNDKLFKTNLKLLNAHNNEIVDTSDDETFEFIVTDGITEKDKFKEDYTKYLDFDYIFEHELTDFIDSLIADDKNAQNNNISKTDIMIQQGKRLNATNKEQKKQQRELYQYENKTYEHAIENVNDNVNPNNYIVTEDEEDEEIESDFFDDEL